MRPGDFVDQGTDPTLFSDAADPIGEVHDKVADLLGGPGACGVPELGHRS